jgi:hypothetical protein
METIELAFLTIIITTVITAFFALLNAIHRTRTLDKIGEKLADDIKIGFQETAKGMERSTEEMAKRMEKETAETSKRMEKLADDIKIGFQETAKGIEKTAAETIKVIRKSHRVIKEELERK